MRFEVVGRFAMGSAINQIIAKLFQQPWLKRFWESRFHSLYFERSPWTPLRGPLAEKRVAMITTGGVHLKSDRPFNMADKDGDPEIRVFGPESRADELIITHDYYDHTDGDKDINIIVPMQALRSCVELGIIGSLSKEFFGLMGHIRGGHIRSLLEHSCHELILRLKQNQVDVVLLAPA